MTLSQFIDNLYGCQELLVLVYNEECYDAMWELVDEKTPIEEYGEKYIKEYGGRYGCAEFALHMKYTEVKLSCFLNEKYANAEVTHFMVTDECILVFIND